jgi:hypothetical protein
MPGERRGKMTEDELLELIRGTGEELHDDAGKVIGYVAQPARFKLDRPGLARGGFLVVTRNELTGEYVGTIFDALPHPKNGRPYPAGHSEEIWRTASLTEAVRLTQAELAQSQGVRHA